MIKSLAQTTGVEFSSYVSLLIAPVPSTRFLCRFFFLLSTMRNRSFFQRSADTVDLFHISHIALSFSFLSHCV